MQSELAAGVYTSSLTGGTDTKPGQVQQGLMYNAGTSSFAAQR